jgi:hypothetical protein
VLREGYRRGDTVAIGSDKISRQEEKKGMTSRRSDNVGTFRLP